MNEGQIWLVWGACVVIVAALLGIMFLLDRRLADRQNREDITMRLPRLDRSDGDDATIEDLLSLGDAIRAVPDRPLSDVDDPPTLHIAVSPLVARRLLLAAPTRAGEHIGRHRARHIRDAHRAGLMADTQIIDVDFDAIAEEEDGAAPTAYGPREADVAVIRSYQPPPAVQLSLPIEVTS